MGVTHHSKSCTRKFIKAGGTAGNHTVTGLEVNDIIESVWSYNWGTDGFETATDLTSEFTTTVTVADSASNAAGSDTTDAMLEFIFSDLDAI